jgi:molecular chaperone DnaK (HSP70)
LNLDKFKSELQGDNNVTEPTFIIGIDLGTTNTILAYTPIEHDPRSAPVIKVLEIPQAIGPGEVAAKPTLPSFIFQPSEHEKVPLDQSLPWKDEGSQMVGRYARDKGGEQPQRLISSAKSWLCNAMVDRNEPILPWQAPEEITKLSPVAASAAFLNHLRMAWNHIMANKDDALALEHQEVFLTVPASFDAVARELTVKASEMANLTNVTLLEEPQAAFYAWIHSCGQSWREQVRPGDVVLVCDLGGGTSDFSLIRVSDEAGDLGLERIAVGDHLLVGGDNMDLALAYAVSQQFVKTKIKLNTWQMRTLWHVCRAAKETLLTDPDKKSIPVSILGRGSGLIGGTIRTELKRALMEQVITDGFFPICERDSRPMAVSKTGIRETGLIFESDPAITRHLAYFLDRQPDQDAVAPTAILFNGGVMKSEMLRHRVMEVISCWNQKDDVKLRQLTSENLDLAVAKGATYYGLARRGKGVRIRSGLAKTYYIGVAVSMPAVPGMPAPIKALCVAPFGMEEGTQNSLPEQEFNLMVGEEASFDFLVSNLRIEDPAGVMIEDWHGEIDHLTTINATLKGESGHIIPVTLEVKLTEIGTLELWCVSKQDNRQRWKLEFNVREQK